MYLKVKFDNKEYNATYNSQSGLYEVEITAPNSGGIYNAEITYEDLLQNIETSAKKIQIWAKEKKYKCFKRNIGIFFR